MSSNTPSILRLIAIGTTIAVLVAGGMLLGWFVDDQASTFPVFTMLGLALGMTIAGLQLYSIFRKFTKDSE